jgi:glucosamine--fructose-6-phosphate aminotransferase (isomerizing)
MGAEQTLLYAEAAEATSVAERQLALLTDTTGPLGRRLRELDPPLVVTCARGSSDHAATFAKYLIETHALTPVASYAPSISSIYGPASLKLRGAVFLAISQSGRSPDILESARTAREAGALVIAIVNDEDSPLAELAEVVVPMLAGPERSVAASKSFIASLLALATIVADWTQDGALHTALGQTAAVLRQAWTLEWSPALAPLTGSNSLFVIGRGLTLAIAQEAALKLKETCGLHAEAFSAAEVRHGPMAIVGTGFPVLLLAPDDRGREAFPSLARDFLARDACVIATGEAPPGVKSLPVIPGLHPALAAIANIQSFYRLAAELSVARGLDPDRPPFLKKVTETQ